VGFAGRTTRKRHREQIHKAFRNGGVKHRPTNTEVVFEGTAEPLVTFEGVYWNATGLMTFKHYDTSVMAIDFSRDRITDFGYTGFSMTTNTNLSAWHHELRDMAFLGMRCLECETNPFRWTLSDRYNEDSIKSAMRGKGYAIDMFLRFRAGVPWVKMINGDPWFCGRQYNPTLEDHYDHLRGEILRDGVSWHWFTADWNARGQWAKRFIDEAAKKRWEKREAKRLRQASYDTELATEAALA
jgi:hypothetical protein